MNSEEFGKKLARRTIRSIPDQWRDGILEAAMAELEPASPVVTLQEPWWRNLLWPSPRAWAGLAAAWVAILFLNAGSLEPSGGNRGREANELIHSPSWSMAMAEQKLLRAELLGDLERRASDDKKPQPRSDSGSNRTRWHQAPDAVRSL
jgi:hypothetical protein